MIFTPSVVVSAIEQRSVFVQVRERFQPEAGGSVHGGTEPQVIVGYADWQHCWGHLNQQQWHVIWEVCLSLSRPQAGCYPSSGRLPSVDGIWSRLWTG